MVNPVKNWAKEQIFPRRELEMALQHMERCSSSLTFSPIRSSETKSLRKYIGEDVGICTFIYLFLMGNFPTTLLKLQMHFLAQSHRHKVILVQHCCIISWLCATAFNRRKKDLNVHNLRPS